MNIVKERLNFFHSLNSFVPKQLKKLWTFGWQILSSQQIISLRSNARLLNLNWHTAKTKAWRLTKNLKFLLWFPVLMVSQGLVEPKDIIAVDFSDFGSGRWVLMFAKQTHKGRSLPVYFEVLEEQNARGFQNTFIIEAIDRFERLLSFRPHLVFDRGFACPSIVAHLCRNSWKFTIRIKKIKTVINAITGEQLKVKDSACLDFLVIAYDRCLRVVISDQKPNSKEPWFLVTNDFTSLRKTVINRYYHRFEIEELFRDAKRLLGLEWLTAKTATSLSVVLWFTIAGLWLFWHLEGRERYNDEHEKRVREVLGLSIVRYYFEQLRVQCYRFGLKAALENSA